MDCNRRVENAGSIPRSKVYIYDFTESIAMEPVIILDAPDDITVFKFSPTMPHIVAGGTKTGQVCLWDISAAESTLKSKNKGKKDDSSEDKAEKKPVHWSVLSFIDPSHSAPVADIQWLPAGQKYDPKGKLHESAEDKQYQFVSASADGAMIIWDSKLGLDVAIGSLDPMCYDCQWNPTWRCNLTGASGGTAMSFEKLQMAEGLKWMASTQEGEVAIGEAFPAAGARKDISICHRGPVVSVQESPFMEGVFLTVGDWTFSIWKEGVSEPLFQSPYYEYLTAGVWSTTRPGLIMVANNKGYLEAWDLLGRNSSIEPAASIAVIGLPLTALKFMPPTGKGTKKTHYLAVGDAAGTLRIMEMPRNLTKPVPNEKALVEAMLEREVQRVAYTAERKAIREVEREAKEAAAAAAAAAAAPPAGAPVAEEEEAMDPEVKAAKEAAEAKEKLMVAAELEFEKAEVEFKIMLGMVEEGEGEEEF